MDFWKIKSKYMNLIQGMCLGSHKQMANHVDIVRLSEDKLTRRLWRFNNVEKNIYVLEAYYVCKRPDIKRKSFPEVVRYFDLKLPALIAGATIIEECAVGIPEDVKQELCANISIHTFQEYSNWMDWLFE